MEQSTLKKMRTSALFHFSFLLFTFSLFAAPAKNAAEPVAEGFPAWTGVTPKNYIAGRVLQSNADLRQRVATVVVEFDAAKTAEQLEKTGSLANLNGFATVIGHGSTNWESVEIPRDVMVIYVAHNVKGHEAVVEGMKVKDSAKNPCLTSFVGGKVPIYENVTFEGAPGNGGKFPFVYVMGHEGTEPLVKEEYGAKTAAAINKAIADQRKKMAEADLKWRPFYGYVAEPKHFHDIEKALAKGKPLDAVEAKLLKSVKASDAEKAKEAQMLCDGLEQTRSDMMWTVQCAYSACPHVAAYKINQLIKYWPKTKKQMSAVSDKIKANSAAQPLIKMYAKIVQWSDPDFTCKNAGEAKKIVAELEKMKKAIAPIKEDAQNIQVQNGALILDGMLDELIAIIPTKVPQK